MTATRLAAAISLALTSLPCLAADYNVEFAKAYAPMFWFAVDEPVHPTLPHPFAFDGVALDTGARPCDLRLAPPSQKPDFENPSELNLDERCDRVSLKRYFRPLLQGAAQGAGDWSGPHPRMRVLYHGPQYFSGGIDITRYATDVCRAGPRTGVGGLAALEATLRSDYFLPLVSGSAEISYSAPSRNAELTPFCRARIRYAADRLPSTEAGSNAQGRGPIARMPEKRRKTLTLSVEPAWWDPCRGKLVTAFPTAVGCVPEPRLVAYSGNSVLSSEPITPGRLFPADARVVMPVLYVMQYWLYYAYDRGVNGHRHDGEHVFVFVEGKADAPLDTTGRVVAVVGGGHEEDTANNILIAGSVGANRALVDQIAFPERLPQHPMILVELGKHASAPDRNLDGRFEMGLDANLWPENAWGSRDTQTALLGKAQIGKMTDWYSLPRSSDGVFVEEGGWTCAKALSSKYATGYPVGLFKDFASRIRRVVPAPNGSPLTGPCDFSRTRSYRLMPVAVIKGLYDTIPNGWGPVREYLEDHKELFWEKDCGSQLPEDDIDGRRFQQLSYWLETRDEKRDVWLHRKFQDPDAVFKTHLFPRISIGGDFLSLSGDRHYGGILQLADLGRVRHLHDSLLELAVFHRPNHDHGMRRNVLLTVENFRGCHRGWYVGAATDRDEGAKRRWYFRAGYAFQLPSLDKLGFAPRVTKRFKLSLRVGGRGLVWGGRPLDPGVTGGRGPGIAFEFSAGLSFGLYQSKHPLKFLADLGTEEKE